MDIDVFKELFDTKFGQLKDSLNDLKKDIDDLRTDICELKKQGQSNNYEVSSCQVLHDQVINDLKKDIIKCSDCVDSMKNNNNKRLWDIVIIIVTALFGIFLGKYF